MIMNVIGLVGWIGGWIVLLGVSLHTPDWVVWICMPYFVYGAYRTVTQYHYFGAALWMRRILRTYPWQVVPDIPHGLTKRPEVVGRQYGWFELPNPARTDQQLPLVFAEHLRTEWWSRRMAPRAKPQLKAEIETVWFAGDPRFVGLIGAPTAEGTAPRRLHIVEQKTDVRSGQRFADWGATPVDIERGRQAGVTPAHP
ncbi:hypothetical protein [Streptomyces justiciae]|uniref:hypothetical protein n=1 Tax=Streptomyces justiciae TaxID=2780140 RepID=UPI001881696F|nr:hypothetical protein [Streptomyces justiciae]MBE8474111.1 hypothetical protein [Streptomyces justiciae]